MKKKFSTILLTSISTLLFTACGSTTIQAPVFEDYEADAAKVVAMIDSITTVDLAAESAIDDAYAAYCLMDENAQKLVSNYNKLEEYRNELIKLYYTEELAGPRMDRSKVNIGTYCVSSMSWTDDGIKALADCGIDFIANASYNDQLLDLLEKYGVGAFAAGVVPSWYSGGYLTNAGLMSVMNPLSAYDAGIESFVDRDCIWGIDIGDEPSTLDLPHYGEVVRYLSEAFPNQIPYLNLMPRGGSTELGGDDYKEHLRLYMESCQMDYICYDRYPYHDIAKQTEAIKFFTQWLYNIQEVQQICNEYDVELWTVIAASNPNKYLSENELRAEASAALTYGARTISWACWDSGWFAHHPIDSNGNKSEVYYSLQKVNREIDLISPVYSRYDNVISGYAGKDPSGYSFNDIPSVWEKFDVTKIENCSISELTIAKESNVVAGYFEKRIGEGSAIMFTNVTGHDFNDPIRTQISFTVKDPDAKVTAYLNGEVIPLTNNGNGNYSTSLPISENLFVTIE